MKASEIASVLYKMYKMTWSEAMKVGMDMVQHQGAYDKPVVDVIQEITKIGTAYVKQKQEAEAPEPTIPEQPSDDWIDYSPQDDEGDIYDGESDDDDELIQEWDELKNIVDTYSTTDKWEVEKSEDLLKDILDQAEQKYGKVEAMRKLNEGYPDLKDDIRALILAVYHGSGYSRTEGAIEEYKSAIALIESSLDVSSEQKWW